MQSIAVASIPVERLEISAYRIPTDFSESDGTFEWIGTNVVVVEVFGGGLRGTGYSYTDAAAATFINSFLRPFIEGQDAMRVTAIWNQMVASVRNLGQTGLTSMAISAVDSALWDLKARSLGIPLVILLGQLRDSVPVYGSGGFTSYSISQTQQQFEAWANLGIRLFKMKVGRSPQEDIDRVRAARQAIGPDAELFVDANGAYTRKQALYFAEKFAESKVTWFEEPVVSDDLEGLRLLRNRAPGGMNIAAGEYGFNLSYFEHMLAAEAVDVLQADATRCQGITGFLQVGPLCSARNLPLSAHTAPSLHSHPCCALPQVCHVEYFHDHARIEQMLFDGLPSLVNGHLFPDLSRLGNGLELKKKDASRFAV